MNDSDKKKFKDLIEAAYSMFGKTPQNTVLKIWFNSLQSYELEEVACALQHVLENSRFLPTLADVRDALTTTDGRKSADEAWAIALQADDETVTVVWTAEIAEAWGIAAPILDEGDKVAARMAFKSAYERIVGDARERGIPVAWQPSLGSDPEGRKVALESAEQRGQLSHDRVDGLLPHREPAVESVSGLIEGAVKHTAAHKEHIDSLRDALAGNG